MSQTDVEKAREDVLNTKDKAHQANSSAPALTDAERSELVALEAKE